ncbi:MAG TPA: hypothetical protein DCL77_03610 [Prolixibacteraceae bacterium]|nr:hypothetical protein [Prolixibacteraceae bacterium]
MDEPPEWWNVSVGEMSLVGRCPSAGVYRTAPGPRQTDLKLANREEGSGKPPMRTGGRNTGPAEHNPVNDHQAVIFADKVRLNARCWETRSFGPDLKIIVYTLDGRQVKEPPDARFGQVVNPGIDKKNKEKGILT